MTTINGPTFEDLTRKARRVAQLARRSLRSVYVLLASDLNPLSPSVDDLVATNTYWESEVDKMLLPNVADGLAFGWDTIRRAFGRPGSDVPEIANSYAGLYLQTSRARLTGLSGVAWLTARDELLEGMRLGESVPDLRDRITGSTNIAAPQAEVIARTEVNGAMNAGALIQMKQIGLPFTKTWISTPGPRTRPSHAAAHGQTVKDDKKFMVGGWAMDRPHDPAGPPEETENCRCTLTFDVQEPRKDKK